MKKLFKVPSLLIFALISINSHAFSEQKATITSERVVCQGTTSCGIEHLSMDQYNEMMEKKSQNLINFANSAQNPSLSVRIPGVTGKTGTATQVDAWHVIAALNTTNQDIHIITRYAISCGDMSNYFDINTTIPAGALYQDWVHTFGTITPTIPKNYTIAASTNVNGDLHGRASYAEFAQIV
jgi:hypothetical protein